MPATIAIAAPQNRMRDSYAAAPNLDLTLRSNGEEGVQVMDSFGTFNQAGFDAPTTAPALAIGTAGSGLTKGTWVGYLYVYAAKTKYPLVDAGTSAGGSIAPRSNPSPSGNINILGASTNYHVNVTLITTGRLDISHIWVYRTQYFTTQQEAIDAADAGTAFYIGEIANNPNVPTVIYDDGTTVAAGEQCDTDNFTAPQFQFCQYFDPYFWGFGNFAFIASCVVATDGTFSVTDLTYKLFPGRNAQVISFAGITTGGFDGHGSYYYRNVGDYLGRVYLDQALTQQGLLDFSGTTQLKIQGQSNILYRSKPHNPFAWGSTEYVGSIRVPSLYTFKIGGGNGTAMAIIPNLNLLKLDTDSPSVSYVLNLRLAGTPSFEISKRELSRGASVSNHFAQFATEIESGNTVLWGYDFKSSSILQCDGSSQISVSSKIFDTLRSFTIAGFNHGIYDSQTELAVFWFSTGGTRNDLAVLYHVPTGNWSTHLDYDVSASATIYDSATGENKTIVGTSTGLVGQAFVDGLTQNWVPNTKPVYIKFTTIAQALPDYTLQADTAAFDTTTPWYWLNTFVRLIPEFGGGVWNKQAAVYAQITSIISNTNITVRVVNGQLPDPVGNMFGFIGYNPTTLIKYSQLNSPTIQKQLTEFFLTGKNVRDLTSKTGWSYQFALELSLFNVFATIANGTPQHFNFNGAQGFYNKSLSSTLEFSSIIGLQLDFISDNIPIEIKDYSLIFENS